MGRFAAPGMQPEATKRRKKDGIEARQVEHIVYIILQSIGILRKERQTWQKK